MNCEPLTGAALIKPVINLNGSAAQALVEDYRQALACLRLAHQELCKIGPHGRDYQTLEELALDVQDQGERR